ncbi:MAG: alpha/beta fold hydrolase [Chloroflexota bacterium]|nr:dienelactone hydrolase family protein [Chloroflexota bacterium]
MTQSGGGPDLTGTTLIEGEELTYLLRLPTLATAKPIPALVMLHGRGANEGDIYELVSYVDQRVLVVAPRAPLLHSEDPRGSFKWYDLDPSGRVVEDLLEASLEKLITFIEQVAQFSAVAVDPRQIYLGGFSQGAAISYALVTTRPDLVAGVIVHSSPFAPQVEARLRGARLHGKPFFVAHGLHDFLTIAEHGQRAARCLREIGADVTYHEYPFAHETSPQSRGDLAAWLNSRLSF